MIINKDTGIALGLVLAIISVVVGAALWVKDGINYNTTQLLLMDIRLASIESSVDTRFDTLRTYIDVHIDDYRLNDSINYTRYDHNNWVNLMEAKNPGLSIPK